MLIITLSILPIVSTAFKPFRPGLICSHLAAVLLQNKGNKMRSIIKCWMSRSYWFAFRHILSVACWRSALSPSLSCFFSHAMPGLYDSVLKGRQSIFSLLKGTLFFYWSMSGNRHRCLSEVIRLVIRLMDFCLLIILFVCLFVVYLFVCLLVCLLVWLFVCLFVCLLVCLLVCLSFILPVL